MADIARSELILGGQKSGKTARAESLAPVSTRVAVLSTTTVLPSTHFASCV